VRLPPLREREGDAARLARHFVATLNERFGIRREIADDALAVLARHAWPGNVRELFHAVEAAVLVSDGPQIRAEHLPAPVRSTPPPRATGYPVPGAAGAGPCVGDAGVTIDELERAHVEAVLAACGGHRAQAARSLGISERNLYRKLHAYGLL
jgi:DNA-binding NtrC family response regulator